MISTSDLEFTGYLRAPDVAKPTAMGLWLHTDVEGRRPLVPELIAAAIYPGRDATEQVVEHLLMLDESGFLTIYTSHGQEWIQLRHLLRVDSRGMPASECPPPPQGSPWESVAVGGAGERARERVLAESAGAAGRWDAWAGEQERGREPVRPLLLDAPPIGCPEHPAGAFRDCGPCGTARRRHDKWVAQQRYEEQLTRHYKENPDDEPW